MDIAQLNEKLKSHNLKEIIPMGIINYVDDDIVVVDSLDDSCSFIGILHNPYSLVHFGLKEPRLLPTIKQGYFSNPKLEYRLGDIVTVMQRTVTDGFIDQWYIEHCEKEIPYNDKEIKSIISKNRRYKNDILELKKCVHPFVDIRNLYEGFMTIFPNSDMTAITCPELEKIIKEGLANQTLSEEDLFVHYEDSELDTLYDAQKNGGSISIYALVIRYISIFEEEIGFDIMAHPIDKYLRKVRPKKKNKQKEKNINQS